MRFWPLLVFTFVGYNTSAQITKDYSEMIAGAFSAVATDGKFTLAALKGTGYSPSTSVDIGGGMLAWSGGCGTGQLELQVLYPTGIAKESYFWADCKTGIEGINYEEYTPGWYRKVIDQVGQVSFIKLTDAEIAELEFDQGQAFWVASALETGKIVSTGAVPTKSIEFLTIKDYSIAAGNGMPVDYTLGDLMATGYAPSTSVDIGGGMLAWSGGCGTGQLELQVLYPTGIARESYFWADCKTGIEGINYEEYSPGWYKKVVDQVGQVSFIKLNADELAAVKAPASKGFWIARGGDEPIKFFVPAPELN